MMSNYQRTMELTGYATNSAGASQKQFEKTMESLEENRRFSLFCGSAMQISPEMESVVVSHSLTIRPSRTLKRLKSGRLSM